MRGVPVFPLWVLLALLVTLSFSRAQVGLRTAPLTAPRAREVSSNDGGGLGLFSKWSAMDLHKNRSSSIESSLAAIFRGVAYGLSTIPTSTSTTSTTTTTTTLPPKRHTTPHNTIPGIQGQSEPDWTDLEGILFETAFEDLPAEYTDMLPDAIDEVEVVRAGTGVELSKAAWVRALGVAWVVHVYCAAGMYSLLAVLALLWLSRVHAATRLLPRGYYITLHLLMFLAAFLRCAHLFHDPYGAEHKLPEALAAVVEEIGWPCLTASIALVVMAVVQAWRCPPHLPPRQQAPIALAVITVFHLMVSICAHLFSVVFPEHSGPLRAASRTATAAWGGVIGFGSFLAVCRVAQATRHRHGHLTVMLSRDSVEGTAQHPRAALIHGIHLSLIAAFVQVILAALHLYGLLGPHYVLQLPPAHPWHWLAFQSTCCLLELLAWVLLALISLLTVGGTPVKRESRKEGRLLSVLWCGWCGSCVTQGAPDNEVFSSACQTSQAVRSYTLQNSANTVPHEALSHSHSPRHVTTTSLHKPAPFRPTAPDVHLLWSHSRTQDAFSSSCSSRPSSMVFNDTNLGRFKRSMNPQSGMSEAPQKSLQNLEAQIGTKKSSLSQKTTQQDAPAYDQHLYYSVPRAKVNSPVKPITSPRFGSPLRDNRFEHHLQNHPCADLDSAASEDGQSRSDVVSMTDNSSTDALSSAVVGDNDWSKYTSTCSSISAANSFDVRMCDDSDVPYYQIPYTASPHVNPSGHQQSPPPHLPHHSVLQGEFTGGVHGSILRQADQVRPYQASRTSSPASSQQNEHRSRPTHDLQTRGSHPELVAPASPPHCHQRIPGDPKWDSPGTQWPPQSIHRGLKSAQTDAPVHLQSTRNTEESSKIERKLPELSQSDNLPQLNSRHLVKVVMRDSSQSSAGNTNVEDLGLSSVPQKCHRAQQTHHRRRSGRGEKVRPCGHLPRTRQESPGVGATTPAVQGQDNLQSDQLHDGPQDEASSTADGATQTDVNTVSSASPSSSRPGSSLGSHSDLPSEGVDSENEVTHGIHEYPQEVKREIGRPPELPPRRHEYPRPAPRPSYNP